MTNIPIRICHITTVHPDGDIRIFHKMCASLAENKEFEVSCIVPNCESRVEKGVKIISFPLELKSRKKRIQLAGKKAFQLAIKENADIYHLHDPELLKIAWKLKKYTKAVVIFDSHEDVPKQLLDKIWIPRYLRLIISTIYTVYEKNICKKLDGVISVTPIICNRFKKFQANVEMIANYPDLNELVFTNKPSEFSKTICYIGGIFKTRGIIELIQAIEGLDVTLLLAGTFETEELKQLVEGLPGWKNVKYFGQVHRTEIVSILTQSEIGIVTLHPTKSYLESYPIKLFEYMASGNAVLASDFPLWREIIDTADCGRCVDPLNPLAIKNTLIEMLDNPSITRQQGENGSVSAKNQYNWHQEFEKLKTFYLKLYLRETVNER